MGKSSWDDDRFGRGGKVGSCVGICTDRVSVTSFFLSLGSRGTFHKLGTTGESSSQPGKNREIEISDGFVIERWRRFLGIILGSITKSLFIEGISTWQPPKFCKPGDWQGVCLAGKSTGINRHGFSLLT